MSQGEGLSLFPALSSRNRRQIERQLLVDVPSLVKLIKDVNKTMDHILETDHYMKVISDSFDEFIKNTKKYYDDIIVGKEGNIGEENFVKYINLLFLLLNARKIYNTSPRDNFLDFYKISCNSQLLRVVIPKGQDLPFLDITTGGSCHNYSIMFKDFFEKIGIKSSIIFCNPVSNHSFLLVEIFGEYYTVDPLFNQKSFIRNVKVGDQVQIGFSHFGIIKSFKPNFFVDWFEVGVNQTVKSSNLKTIEDTEKFAINLDKRRIKYIIVENYINTINGTFRLEIGKESGDNFFISISLGDRTIEYFINFKKVSKLFSDFKTNSLGNFGIISKLISYIYSTKGKKQPIKLEDILKCTSEIGYMIKRDDLLSLLNLNE